jgi:hypothetical protein
MIIYSVILLIILIIVVVEYYISYNIKKTKLVIDRDIIYKKKTKIFLSAILLFLILIDIYSTIPVLWVDDWLDRKFYSFEHPRREYYFIFLLLFLLYFFKILLIAIIHFKYRFSFLFKNKCFKYLYFFLYIENLLILFFVLAGNAFSYAFRDHHS